jgi:hypothetical protein
MPTIFAGNESRVLVEGELIEGVRSLEYRKTQARTNVYALGASERIGMVSGALTVEGRVRVASTSKKLDTLELDKPFALTAQLQHGDTKVSVAFDECFLLEKTFDLEAGTHGESVYCFSATRVTENFG